MSLYLYNTETRAKTLFEPLNPSEVTLYVCGPTVYNYIHIGNARPAVVFDTLFRFLRHYYPNVIYARNITDIDDKIMQKAEQTQQSIASVSQMFTAAYHEDLAGLSNLPPTLEPKATDHIEEMLSLITDLIQSKHAYATEEHVLFDVTSFKDYGKLSGRSLDEMIAGARIEPLSFKKHPGDFVLWKPSLRGQPGWPSPWGLGRPGWHIECSAMIRKHLGNQIDIHGGGQDLIFPHHENEIAQSECASCGQPSFVQYWMHNGYITMDHQKMSKSLGNFITLRDLLKQHHGEVLRYALLSTHYRAPLNWSDTLLSQTKSNLDRLYQSLRGIEVKSAIEAEMDHETLSALADDLNTPLALRRLNALAHDIQKTEDVALKQTKANRLKQAAHFLGLLQQTPEMYFQFQATESNAGSALSMAAIETLIAQRNQARQSKDFQSADSIRQQLLEHNIELEDGPTGTQWRYR